MIAPAYLFLSYDFSLSPAKYSIRAPVQPLLAACCRCILIRDIHGRCAIARKMQGFMLIFPSGIALAAILEVSDDSVQRAAY